jgi:hypothetical protein
VSPRTLAAVAAVAAGDESPDKIGSLATEAVSAIAEEELGSIGPGVAEGSALGAGAVSARRTSAIGLAGDMARGFSLSDESGCSSTTRIGSGGATALGVALPKCPENGTSTSA